ncbi:MAG: RnfABCDGE type electron transport complex subunit D, partial [Pseudomonadota bacterium]
FALLPATLFGFYLYGWPAIFLFIVTIVAAIVTEILSLHWLKQPWYRVFDGTALLTAWLIAMTLPPWAPWWIGMLGAFFAIAVGKQLYGGLGQNLFNPAMLARTALLITFPLQMTTWVMPAPFGSEAALSFQQGLEMTFFGAAVPDALTGATYLGDLKTSLTMGGTADEFLANDFSLGQAILGFTPGSLAESSELLVLLGGAFLLWRKIITWEIPVALLTIVVVFSSIMSQIDETAYANPLFHLSAGGLMLGAFFIATDPVTAPISRVGKLLFGAGCGLVIFVIRTWGGFPEAVAFAVLFMNGFTPLLDRYCRPRPYGRSIKGEPLPLPTQIELAREVNEPK